MFAPEFLSQLEHLSLLARRLRRGAGAGNMLTRRRGNSAEFSDYRPYTPGDELRFLDWNIYGRLELLCTKLFLEEEALELQIILDASASMTGKFAYAGELAAAVGYIALAGGHRVRLAAASPAGSLPAVTPRLKGRSAFPRLRDFLERLTPGGRAPLTALGETAAALTGAPEGGGVRLLISDFLASGEDSAGGVAAGAAPEDVAAAEIGKTLTAASRRGCELYALQLLSAEEITPAFTGAAALTGLEDGHQLKFSGSPELFAAYRQTLAAYRATITRLCRERGAHYAFFSTAMDLRTAVLASLRQAGLLR